MSDFEVHPLKAILDSVPDWFAAPDRPEDLQSQSVYPYTALFSPYSLNELILHNRIVAVLAEQPDRAGQCHAPVQLELPQIRELAAGGAGLILGRPVLLGPDSNWAAQRQAPGFRDQIAAAWKSSADVCRSLSSRYFAVLSAGGGRIASAFHQAGQPLYSASRQPARGGVSQITRRLSDFRLTRMVSAYRDAALLAQQAGAAGLALGGQVGGLFDQLTDPATNRRIFSRFRKADAFALACVRGIRDAVGPAFPLLMQLNLSSGRSFAYGDLTSIPELQKLSPERSWTELADYLSLLVAAGVDGFIVTLGSPETAWLSEPADAMPAGALLPAARAVRETLQKAAATTASGQLPAVIAVDKIESPNLAETVVREEGCDLIAPVFALNQDPQWPAKAYARRVGEIQPIRESVSRDLLPELEAERIAPAAFMVPDAEQQPLGARRQIAVVGAGAAGAACALALSKQGHQVDLFEQAAEPGGALRHAAVPAFNVAARQAWSWLKEQLTQAAEAATLNFYPQTQATLAMLADNKYDSIVLATGLRPVTQDFPGRERCLERTAVLEDVSLLGEHQKVAVIGSDREAVELALWLATEQARAVTLIAAAKVLMAEESQPNRSYLMQGLLAAKVTVIQQAMVLERTETAVKIQCPGQAAAAPLQPWREIKRPSAAAGEPVETVEEQVTCEVCILALPKEPDRDLYQLVQSTWISRDVQLIGAAHTPSVLSAAWTSGVTVAKRLHGSL